MEFCGCLGKFMGGCWKRTLGEFEIEIKIFKKRFLVEFESGFE